MTEAFTGAPSPINRESRAKNFSREINKEEVDKLRWAADYMGVELYKDMPGFQGGGILGQPDKELADPKKIKENIRGKAAVLGKTKGSSEPNTVVHFPTNKEHLEYPANFYAYQQHLGEYIRQHWNTKDMGTNPLQGVFGHVQLEDGRYVIATQYRKNYEPLGQLGPLSTHEMDTSRISPDELKQVVRVLDAMHVDSKAFDSWAKPQIEVVPDISWMNSKNPNYAFRGKEWWISPDGGQDRLTELTDHINKQSEHFRAIDPSFDPSKAVREMIHNNIDLYPRKDGTIDNPALAAETVVVHGALHPDNVHIKRGKNGALNVTVSGGDRAQGMGLRGQMVDWLITSAVNAPEHRQAMIDEFLKLHPSDKDKRSLAMHVMYRSILETSWFERRGSIQEAKKLSQLTYDILNGNGVWTGVNTPQSL